MPHPQQVNHPYQPTKVHREKNQTPISNQHFSNRQCFMFNASSERKEFVRGWNCRAQQQREISNLLLPARSQKRGIVVCRDRELRPRDRGERSDPSGGSFRLIRLNPSPSVCVVALRGEAHRPVSRFQTTRNGLQGTTKRKRKRRRKKSCYQEPGEKENGIPGWVWGPFSWGGTADR